MMFLLHKIRIETLKELKCFLPHRILVFIDFTTKPNNLKIREKILYEQRNVWYYCVSSSSC